MVSMDIKLADLKGKNFKKFINLIKEGAIGIYPSDTIYGVMGSALNPVAVERIYDLKNRSEKKPMIVMISSLTDLKSFDIDLTDKLKVILKAIWPNPVSVVLECTNNKYRYLHRDKNSLALRIPHDKLLTRIVEESGPIVLTSANQSNLKPAQTITQAKKYFNSHVDFYIDGGKITGLPSTVIEIKNYQIKILRQGAYQIKPELFNLN